MPRPVIIFLSVALAGGRLAAQDTAHVVVVATTDVHGHVLAWDYVQDRSAPWGLVRAATVVDSLRRAYAGAVVLVDAGDLIQGNPFATYFATVRPRLVNPVIDAMNAMRYDAATPGNHDFNFGLDVLQRTYAQAAFSIVAANVYRLDRDTTAFPPHVVFPRGGVRVGVTGLTTPGTMIWDAPRVREHLAVRPLRAVAAQAVARTRAAGADLVVALAHAGLDTRSSYDTTGVGPENDAAALAAGPDRPDVVIVGHTHGRLRDSVINGVHFVQPQAWARSVSVVHVWLVPGGPGGRFRVARVRAEEVPLGDVAPDPVLARHLRDADEEVRYWAGGPLAVTEGDWSSREARVRDTPFLDFINEVQRRRAGAQLSTAAAFTTTVDLGPGPVRLRDVAGVYPYENTLRAIRIPGDRLKAYLEQSAAYFRTFEPGGPIINDEIPGYDYDVVSGVNYEIDLSRPVGSRIRGLSYEGRAVTPADTFTMAVNSYRQSGGGGFDMLRGLPVVYDRGEDIRSLLEEALRDAGTARARDYYRLSWRLAPEPARVAALAAFVPPAVARDTTLLRVVVTGALRGALEPGTMGGRAVGGLAAAAARADSLARACPCPTFRIDAGGAFYGSPLAEATAGRAVAEAFAAMHVDAVAPGIRDLAIVGDTTRRDAARAGVAWTAVNLPSDTAAGVVPWVLLERAGRSLAVIGVAPGAGRAGDSGDHATASIAAVLPAVQAAQPDAILVAGDFDAACDSGCAGEAVTLLESLDSAAVHAVLGGAVATTVRGVPVVPVLAYGIGLSVVDVVRRRDGTLAIRPRVDTLWADAVTPDTTVRAVVRRHAGEVRRLLDRPVATLRFALAGAGAEALPLGRLLADAVRTAARGEVALVPTDAMHGDLPGGPVRVGDLLRLLPEPSPVVRLSVTGEALLAALERAVSGTAPSVHVAGLTVRYDPRRQPGRRVREARLDDGRRVERRRTYAVATTEALLAGTRGSETLGAAARESVRVSDRDALTRYLGLLQQPVEAPPTARFVVTR